MRNDLSGAWSVVLNYVVVDVVVGEGWHCGCCEGAGEEGEDAADL